MTTVLALRAIGLGDFVTGLPALQLLREECAGARLVLAAPAHFAPLLSLGLPVDELCPAEELAPIPWTEPVALAVDLHGNGPASRRLLDELQPDRVIGFGYPGRPGPAWRTDEHEVQRWQRLVSEGLDRPPRPVEVSVRVPELAGPVGRTVIHPGAAAPSRRWPTERFAAVARRLQQAGHEVLITGTEPERKLVQQVCSRAGVPGWTGPSLLELFALVARARLVVCGDTGVAHVASLYRTASVLLFGPVSPSRWGPPADGPHRVLWHGDGTGDPHAPAPDPALLRIQVTEVIEAAEAATTASVASATAGSELGTD